MTLILPSFFSIKILYLLSFIVLQSDLVRGLAWNCAQDVNGFKFNLDRISGTWYELARIPPSKVPACVSVEAPDTIDNGTYNLRVNYINNVNHQWRPTSEDLVFPWNENTQNGVFEQKYGSEAVSITFIFKIMYTDYRSMAAICYYTNFAPSASMIKIMTRQQEVNETTKAEAQKLADKFGVADQITWVEQSNKCNGANMTTPTSFGLLLLVFIFIYKTLNKVKL